MLEEVRVGPHWATACILGVQTRIRSRQNLQPNSTLRAQSYTASSDNVRRRQNLLQSILHNLTLQTPTVYTAKCTLHFAHWKLTLHTYWEQSESSTLNNAQSYSASSGTVHFTHIRSSRLFNPQELAILPNCTHCTFHSAQCHCSVQECKHVLQILKAMRVALYLRTKYCLAVHSSKSFSTPASSSVSACHP